MPDMRFVLDHHQGYSLHRALNPNRTAEQVIAMYSEHAYVFCMYMASKFSSNSLGFRYWLTVAQLTEEKHHDA
jgi:hypothetical protein